MTKKSIVCDNCKSEMAVISSEQKMVEMDEDITDGQMADYMAAELSGNLGDWGATETSYKCKNCGNLLILEELE